MGGRPERASFLKDISATGFRLFFCKNKAKTRLKNIVYILTKNQLKNCIKLVFFTAKTIDILYTMLKIELYHLINYAILLKMAKREILSIEVENV